MRTTIIVATMRAIHDSLPDTKSPFTIHCLTPTSFRVSSAYATEQRDGVCEGPAPDARVLWRDAWRQAEQRHLDRLVDRIRRRRRAFRPARHSSRDCQSDRDRLAAAPAWTESR